MKFFYMLIFLSLLVASCASENPGKTPSEKKADLYYSHGTTLLISKDYTEALDYLLKAVSFRKDDSKIHNNLGMAYFFKGETSLALKHLKKSLQLDQENSDARNNLASVYFKIGDIQKSKDQYNYILKNLVYKHQYRTYYNLALINIKEGNRALAIKNLTLSIRENDSYCIAHYKLGLLRKEDYQFQMALKHFKSATMGQCLTSLDRLDL